MSGIRTSQRRHDPILKFDDRQGNAVEINVSKLRYSELIDFKKTLELDCHEIKKHMRNERDPHFKRQEMALKTRRRMINVCDHEFSYRKVETKVGSVHHFFMEVAKEVMPEDQFAQIYSESKKRMLEAKDDEMG